MDRLRWLVWRTKTRALGSTWPVVRWLWYRVLCPLVAVLLVAPFLAAMFWAMTPEVHPLRLPVPAALWAAVLWLWRQFRRDGSARKHERSSAPRALILRGFVEQGRDLKGRSLFDYYCESLLDVVEKHLRHRFSVVTVRSQEGALATLPVHQVPVSSSRWKEEVLDLMDGSALILVFLAGTYGVQWELETAFSKGMASKTVLLVPPVLADGEGKHVTHDSIRLTAHTLRVDEDEAGERIRRAKAVAMRHGIPMETQTVDSPDREEGSQAVSFPMALAPNAAGGLNELILVRNREPEEVISADEYRAILRTALSGEIESRLIEANRKDEVKRGLTP